MIKGSRVVIYGLSLVALLLMGASEAYAQKMPERRLVREGNREYQKGKYVESEVEYRRALEKNPTSYEAEYNLTNSLYKQERYEESAKKYSTLAQQEGVSVEESARDHYNAGNSLFQQRKFEEALEEYKQSLRKNPNDVEAKYNLAYTKKMLEQQEQEDDQNKDDKEDQDDKDNKEDKGDDDQKKDDSKDDKKDDGKSDEKEQQGPPNKPSTMSKEEAKQLLEAMQMNEDKTRDKMDEKEVTAVGKSGKNW